jgi:hypothetical protein
MNKKTIRKCRIMMNKVIKLMSFNRIKIQVIREYTDHIRLPVKL